MSVETRPRHLRLDQAYVDGEFERIVERFGARHALEEPTQPLPFTPRSNTVPVPAPRQPIDDLPPTPLDPEDTITEARRPGKHRAPRASLIEWLGGRTSQKFALTMLAAGIALQGTGTLIEDSLDRQTAYNLTLEEPAIVFPNMTEPVSEPTPTTKPTATPTKLTPTSKPVPPKAATPRPSPTHTTATPTQKPMPIHPKPTPTTAKKPTVAAPKKPTVASVDHWPAPGTNCNYLPEHQHKASTTSAAQAKAIFKKMVIACWGAKEWPAAEQLWQHESNFRPMARNPNGGACGVVQALPCRKLLRATGANSLGNTTVEKQAWWGVRYVKAAYGTPTRAWRHWRASVNINGREVGHWY